jgi:hypothetical protein
MLIFRLDLPEHPMSTDDVEWIAQYLAVRIERMRTAHGLTLEMLRRSCEQLARSEQLLKLGVPAVWHPEPPISCSSVPSINSGDGEAPRRTASSRNV